MAEEHAREPHVSAAPSPSVNVWARIKEHKIAQWTLAYAAAAYALLDGTKILSEAFDWPHWLLRAVAALLVLGLPLMVTLAWYHGHRALRRVSGAELTIITVLLVIAGGVLWHFTHAPQEPSASKSALTVTTTTPATPAAAISNKSVAVLPFVDMSEKHDQEYLSDGLSEELIDMLAKVPDLRVPARTSSFYFKGKPDDISTIASRLKVAHVLEGSVRKSGNNLRVTAQLIRADSGYHMWSQTYDRKLDDIFKVQDDIAGAVVDALKVSLLGAAKPQAIPTSNSEAYTLYLQARSMLRNASTHADDERAFAYLRKALTLDPGFAPAWATLAGYRCDDAVFYEITFDAQGRGEVHDAAARALALDPNLSEAHYAMGKCLQLIEWDWKASEAELRRALELDPLNIDALAELSSLLRRLDAHSQEAVLLAKRLVDRDPLYAFNFRYLAMAYFVDGKFPEAEQAMRQALDLSSTADGLHLSLARVLLYRGDAAAALNELEREPNEQFRESLRPQILDALGRTSEADRALTAYEAKYANVAPYEIAAVYAKRKALDQAFGWLDRAYRQRHSQLSALRVDPDFTSLRLDPRYKALLKKMNLPE